MSPAHLRKIYENTCEAGSCTKKATERLYNTRNALIGHYCGRHATAALSRTLNHDVEDAEMDRR